MEYLLHKMRRHFGKTNSLQIILTAIAIHSFISIVMIYLHLVWYFNVDSSSRLESENYFFSHIKSGISLRDGNNELNVISSEIINSSDISHIGWWNDHHRWNINVQCFNHKWSICSKVYSTQCKSDSIRAIYQYVPIRNNVHLNGVDISVRVNAEQLIEQNNDHFYGVIILVQLSDGSTENIRLQFPSELNVWTKRSTKYSSKVPISSLTVMLLCYGYSGTVSFTDILIVPSSEYNHWKKANEIIARCLHVSRPLKFNKQIPNLKHETLSLTDFETKSRRSNITFVSQISLDRLIILEQSLQSWTGPVSLTIYIPVKDLSEGILEWQKKYIMKKLRSLNITSDSHINVVAGIEDNDYPINAMRNIAMKHVTTKYMFLTDADFQPKPDFEQTFASVISKHKYELNDAFVVPAFEYLEMPKKGDNIPKTKEEFLQLIHRYDPLVQPFRVMESTDAHRLTDYWRWYYANAPYKVNGFSDKYEPYLIVEKTDDFPKFDERFTGYGMNKVTHTTELHAAKYNFYVLHNQWMIHIPHKASQYSQEFLQSFQQRLKNRAERFEFLSWIIEKYDIKINGCN